MKTFTTMTDAIADLEIALGEFADDFNLEAIADEVFDGIMVGGQYRIAYREMDEDTFWDIVASHDVSK